jgi:hypothetical protein
VQVAGPTASGATLVAFDRGHRICTELRDSEASQTADCSGLPSRTRLAHVNVANAGPSRMLVSIVVPAGGATEAEVVGSNGAATRVPIGPGGYAGRLQGRVAFGLAEIAAPRLRIVRFFDATGRKLAVYEDPFYSFEAPPSASAPFARGRRWHATAEVRDELRPSPLDAEHREGELCMVLHFDRQPDLSGPACTAVRGFTVLFAVPQLGTCRTPAAVTVFTASVIGRVRATFGDGSTRTVRTRPFPFATDGRRAAVVVAPRRLAIRSVGGIGPGGTPMGAADVAADPATARCRLAEGYNAGGVVALLYSVAELPQAPSAPTEPALVMRQEGALLCLGIDRIASTRACQVPSAEDDLFQDTERHYTDGSVAYAGIVDPRVATVTAVDATGRRVSVATRPLPAEAGDYAAVARGFLMLVPRPAVLLRLRNAAGRLEYERPTRDGIAPVAPFRVGARSHGVRLLVGRQRLGTRTLGPCVVAALRDARPKLDTCALVSPDLGLISVPCSPRLTIAYGRLPRRATGAHLELASGATISADVDPRTRVWIAAAPSTAALRSIVVTGTGGSTLPLSLPPAGRQCGYTSFVFDTGSL